MSLNKKKVFPYKSDIEMWHKFAEFAEQLKTFAEWMESEEIRKCRFYEYDSGSCEEYCHCPKLVTPPDLGVSLEPGSEFQCWKCEYREVKS